MTLVGHRHSVVGVSLVYNPTERAATVDECGVVKIWNIDKAQGIRGTMLQSVMIMQSNNDLRVFSFVTLQNNGMSSPFVIGLGFFLKYVGREVTCYSC